MTGTAVGTRGRQAIVLGCLLAAVAGWMVASLLASRTSALSSIAPAAGLSAAGPHDGLRALPLAAQGPVSAALGRDLTGYGIDGLRAGNRANGLRARFSSRGVSVVWAGGAARLRLVWIARGGQTRPVSPVTPVARGNSVTYTHPSVIEQWSNGPLGLEQRFVIGTPPAGRGGDLTVGLRLRDGSEPSLRDGGVALGGGLRYGGLLATDATGRTLPAWITLTGRGIAIHVDAAGARYPVRIDPFVQLADILPSSGAGQSNFGGAVAISGDTAVVGAGGNAEQTGAAYVFVAHGGVWADATQTAVLTSSTSADDDGFGAAVAISGATVVVGAPQADSYQGRAYVFVEPSGGWASTGTPSATLTDPLTPPQGPSFGYSVAVTQDAGDDVVVVGSYNHDPGHAYVWVAPSGSWSGTPAASATLQATTATTDDRFGFSVAVSGDTIVVGAPYDSGSAGVYQGAAYVFSQSSPSGWTGTITGGAQLTASDAAYDDNFGASVALSEVNGDDTVAIGAPNHEFTVGYQGAVYVFTAPVGSWTSTTQKAELMASDATLLDALGTSVAVSGDGSTVVASAPGHPSTGGRSGPGAAYVFVQPSGGSWTGTVTQSTELVGANEPSDSVGGAEQVAMSGSDIAVGNPNALSTDEGDAWIFGPPQATTTTTTTPVGVPPSNTGSPKITGSPLPGDTLTCSPGQWSGNPTSFEYRWYRDRSSIAGATHDRYTVQILDEAQTLACRVTAVNGAGASAPAASPGVLVAVRGTLHCPKPTGRLTSAAVGPLALGMTQTAARARLHRFTVTRNGFDNFCLYAGWGIRVAYPSAKLRAELSAGQRPRLAGRIILALTANPYYVLDGFRPGDPVSTVVRRLHLGRPFNVGSNDWYISALGSSSHGIVKVRRGIIQEVGLVNAELTRTRAAQSVLLRGFPDI